MLTRTSSKKTQDLVNLESTSKNNQNQNLVNLESTSPVANMTETELVNLNMKKAELELVKVKINKLVNPTNKVKPVANMSKADLTTLMTRVKVHLDKMNDIHNRYKRMKPINCELAKSEFNTAITKFDKNEISKLTIDNILIFTKEDQSKLTTLELELTNINCVNEDEDIIDIHSRYYGILYYIWSYVTYSSGVI